jgi:hypothetical protein
VVVLIEILGGELSPAVLFAPIVVLAIVGGVFEANYRLSNYIILHDERVDVSEWPWAERLARIISRIRYDHIERVEVSGGGEVAIDHRLPLSGGKLTSYTVTTTFRPTEPPLVASDIRERAERAKRRMSFEVETGSN